MIINTRRIERKLTEFSSKASLSLQEAAELSGIIQALEVEGNVDLTLPGSTAVDTGIAVAAPSVTFSDLREIESRLNAMADADIERKQQLARAGLSAAVGIGTLALTGGSGPAVAGALLNFVKTLS
jgi:prophage tail gpP-like protein